MADLRARRGALTPPESNGDGRVDTREVSGWRRATRRHGPRPRHALARVSHSRGVAAVRRAPETTMYPRLHFFLATLAALPLLAADARAGGISIGYSKHGHGSSFGVQVGFPVYAPRAVPVQYAGCWETVVERVWVPGTCDRVWVEPVFVTRYDACGRPYQACARAGYWNTVQRPGHYEERTQRVWRPAGVYRHGYRGYREG